MRTQRRRHHPLPTLGSPTAPSKPEPTELTSAPRINRRGVLLDPGAFGGGLRVWINGRRAALNSRDAEMAA